MKTDTTNLLVSVHMPVFNGEKTIEKALRSLRLQTHENWEAIVVNDGSADRTREIVQSVSDERIRLIDLPENRGRAYARQVALENSTGDFIAYLDCDDFYHPKKLERQLDYFSKNEKSVFCGCGIGSLDVDGSLRRVRSKKTISSQTFSIGDPFPCAPAVSMIRAEIAQLGSYDPAMRLAEDTDYFLTILDGRQFGAVCELLYFYAEYESVTIAKIIKSYLYTLKAAPKYVSGNLFFGVMLALRTILKIFFVAAARLVLSADQIIDRRGEKPTEQDLKNYRQAIKDLK